LRRKLSVKFCCLILFGILALVSFLRFQFADIGYNPPEEAKALEASKTRMDIEYRLGQFYFKPIVFTYTDWDSSILSPLSSRIQTDSFIYMAYIIICHG